MASDELSCWKTDPECIELMNFLIERTKDVGSPISINGLAREFKQKSGSSQTISCLFYRIRTLREKAAELDKIDTATKVKMMFALSAPIDEDFLKELRVDSHVEVDGKNRITEYKANDGRLEFEGDHSGSAKRKMKFKKMISEKSQKTSLKTPGSVKRPAAELSNSSKRAKDSSPARSMNTEDDAPNDSAGTPESKTREPPIPEIQQLHQPKTLVSEKIQNDSDDGSQESVSKTPGSVKRAAPEVPNLSERAKDSSSAASMESEDHAPNDSARTPESGAGEPPNPGIQSPRQLFPETPRARTRQEAPVFRGASGTPGDEIPPEKPFKTEPGVDDAYTPRIKLLEAIQSLVLSLDMPSLSPLLARIEKKLRELSSNDKIPNDEMAAALELLVVKITNDSVPNLPEAVESVSLSHFLCYLKSLILNSKLEGLENLLEKIKGRIKDPSTKDKPKMPPKIDWVNDPECIKLMKFLIERTKDAKSPLNINQLAREFKEKSGSSLNLLGLVSRINKLRPKILQLDTIDKETKVKMIFALSVTVDENLLKELQKDAEVEVDGKNRIAKYKAKDESLELNGDHSMSAKIKDDWKQKKRDSQGDSGDVSRDSIPKTSGSVKRSAAEVPNSSKKTKVKSEDSAPDDSVRIPSRKPAAPNPETQLLRQPKLEGDPGAEEAPIFRSGRAPRASGAPAPIRPNSEATDAYTPRTKFLEAIQFLILNLDTPSLSPLKTKIDEKLRESPNVKITNDEIIPVIELLVAKIAKHSMLNLPENVESVRFSDFLCFLQAAIFEFEIGGTGGFIGKDQRKNQGALFEGQEHSSGESGQ